MTQVFNPFTDRLSRDIRNELSESLPEAIAMGSLEPVFAVADHFLAGSIPEPHQHYISSRLEKYETAFARLPADTDDYLAIAVILWDLDLFFEVHEISGAAMDKSAGRQKTAAPGTHPGSRGLYQPGAWVYRPGRKNLRQGRPNLNQV